MRLLQANKILLASCCVVVPLSFYGGLALKERYLAAQLDADDKRLVHERAMRARIVQLAQERAELEEEARNVDAKLADLRGRMKT
ncbi:hypothetical protein Q5752_001400 [Cryptotrichosporon argae]